MNRFISLALIFTIFSPSLPAAPQVIVGLASEWKTSFLFWLESSGVSAKVSEWVTGEYRPTPQAQEGQEQRDLSITRVQIYPGDVTLVEGQTVSFAAVAYDSEDATVGGVRFEWSARDEGRGKTALVTRRGDFKARLAGTYTVTAEAAGRRAQVTVTVKEGTRTGPGQQNQGAPATRQVSSRDLPKVASAPQAKGVERHGAHARAKRSPVSAATAVAPAPLPQDSYYDDGNYWSADDPGNQVGDTPGGPADDGAGSGNFQFAAPVLSLPGRGIDLTLALEYNSRLWNKAGSEISYDIDKGWPAPGWNLGFGKMLAMGVNNGAMLIEADGTRHPYSGTVTFGPNQNYTDFFGHTTDGTFIDYYYHSGTGGAPTTGWAKHPDGTVVEYVPGGGHLYPSRITDAQGNFVTITYLNNTGPQIQTITDTLGRVVTFHYDANNLLTAITAPGLTSGTTRTLVRLHYKQLTLNYAFSGLTPRVTNSAPWVIDAIYFPATGTGYWFNDADSYSPYGMIARVREQRGMTHSASSLTVQGTMTKGTESSESAYSYPTAPNAALTDAPTYSTKTDTWDGMDTAAAVTTYSAQPNATPRRTEITMPNGTRSVQLSYNAPGQYNDGLVYQDETFGPGSPAPLLQKSVVTWEAGAYDSPRPARMELTDERGQLTASEFDYGTVYNQTTEVRNYDYGGAALLRVTRTQYENSTNYTNRHIFNLVKQVEVFASNGTTRVSRTEYTYDGEPLADAPGVMMHDDAWNPHAPQHWVPEYCYPTGCNQSGCGTTCVPGHYETSYRPETDYRGNVTQVKTYANAATLAGPVTESHSYDITGNTVTVSSSCCEQASFTYTSATQFAYPAEQTRGSATDATKQVTSSASYSFNTGLILSSTDANGRTTQTAYFATTLRPQKVTLPSGAYSLFAYDDAAMTLTETSYLSGGTVIASKNVKRLNGLGEVAQEEALTRENAVDYWDVVETMYDKLGRPWKQSLPYRSGQTPQWGEVFYDQLGRIIKTRAPDGSESLAFYNEADRPVTATTLPGQTVRMVDAWGKERWGRSDASGRLVEVIEPAPAGNGLVQDSDAGTATVGTLVTKYTYDTLGNLTLVTQGSQTRKFKYDSLGRLTHQKLAERAAMLNDAGAYVTTGGLWSDVFTYDARSNLTQHTDARNVKANYNYNNDPLNRIQTISYDITGAEAGVLAAPDISYTYVTTGDVTRVDTITTAGVSTDDYDYDSEGRVSSVSQTLNARPSYPLETDYSYDTLDRVFEVRYPAQYGVLNSPRKVVRHEYDVASRISGLKVDGVFHASSIVYNPASQTTSLKVGAGTNQITESYTYEALTGLLSNQKVQRGTTTLMDLSYDYLRTGTTAGRTGQLTKITNNLDAGRNRAYEYDALGRLQKATGSSATPWSQTYTYDRYGNRLTVTAAGNADNGTPVPRDGFASLAYAAATNRISTAGWQYDSAGNQTRTQSPGGAWQRYQYDAAGRLVRVTNDAGGELAEYTYGPSNARLVAEESGQKTYYAWGGAVTLAEYVEASGQTAPQWSKSYVYLGSRLLSTITPGGAAERVEYHHTDRLGTRLVTNNVDTTSFEQVSLPYGTALDAESTGSTSKRFTSYDRSATTGLDYAVNRHYDPDQGRFTQVDPLGMRASSLSDPQTLNMYAYCGNDPVNYTDPGGLFFGKLFKWLGKIGKIFKTILKIVAVALLAAIAVAFIAYTFGAASSFGAFMFNWIIKPLGYILTAAAGGSGLAALGPGGTATWNPNAGSGVGWNGFASGFQQDGVPDCSTGAVPCDVGGSVVVNIGGWARLIPIIARHVGRAGKWLWQRVIVPGSKWFARKFVDFAKWAGDKFIRALNRFKKTPRLQGNTPKEMLDDALGYLKSRGGSAADKANLFERFTHQISGKFPGWTATRTLGTDGSHIFIGGMAHNMLVIGPTGQIFRGSALTGIRYVGNTVTPIYEALIPIP